MSLFHTLLRVVRQAAERWGLLRARQPPSGPRPAAAEGREMLRQPPFPPLAWADDGWWEGTAVLPAWAGFQSRRGPYGGRDREAPSDGSAALSVTPWDPDEDRLPSETQGRAWRFQVEHGGEVVDSVLAALGPYYDRLRPDWAAVYDEEEMDEIMPEVREAADFRALIGLHHVHVHPWLRDGMAYVGLELGCTWDEEHGLGVMLHGVRVVEIGPGEVSFARPPGEAENP